MTSPSFDELLRLVRCGSLSVTFVLGLARGGTTATERHLYHSLHYDTHVNEPSLLGPPPSSSSTTAAARPTVAELVERADAREEATFSVVLGAVRTLVERSAAEGRDLRRLPLRVIVKEVTNKVMPRTVPRWVELSSFVVVVVRNPLLQVSSGPAFNPHSTLT